MMGGPNAKALRDMQNKLAKMQEDLASATVEATAGGGAVKVVMTGQQQVQTVTIDPDAVDPEDVEMLQDLIVAAVNEGLRKAQELQAQGFGGITSALGGMPGLGNLLGQ